MHIHKIGLTALALAGVALAADPTPGKNLFHLEVIALAMEIPSRSRRM